jgi:hypothetical protein
MVVEPLGDIVTDNVGFTVTTATEVVLEFVEKRTLSTILSTTE